MFRHIEPPNELLPRKLTKTGFVVGKVRIQVSHRGRRRRARGLFRVMTSKTGEFNVAVVINAVTIHL